MERVVASIAIHIMIGLEVEAAKNIAAMNKLKRIKYSLVFSKSIIPLAVSFLR